jgi:hypothetical protein
MDPILSAVLVIAVLLVLDALSVTHGVDSRDMGI